MSGTRVSVTPRARHVSPPPIQPSTISACVFCCCNAPTLARFEWHSVRWPCKSASILSRHRGRVICSLCSAAESVPMTEKRARNASFASMCATVHTQSCDIMIASHIGTAQPPHQQLQPPRAASASQPASQPPFVEYRHF